MKRQAVYNYALKMILRPEILMRVCFACRLFVFLDHVGAEECLTLARQRSEKIFVQGINVAIGRSENSTLTVIFYVIDDVDDRIGYPWVHKAFHLFDGTADNVTRDFDRPSCFTIKQSVTDLPLAATVRDPLLPLVLPRSLPFAARVCSPISAVGSCIARGRKQ